MDSGLWCRFESTMADENVGSSPRLAVRVLSAGEVTRNLFFTRMLVHVGQSTLRRIVVPMSCDKLAFEFPGDEAFERIILEVDGSVGGAGAGLCCCVFGKLSLVHSWTWLCLLRVVCVRARSLNRCSVTVGLASTA